jgi:serine/threonine protein kinase
VLLGVVFRARNRLDDRVYAIKKVVFKDNSERTRRQAKCALREVRVLALMSHPNIVQYHCAWLELVPCETSTQRLRSASPAASIEKPRTAEYRYDSVDKLIQFQDGSSSARENQKESVEMRSSPVTSSTSQEDDEDGSEVGCSSYSPKITSGTSFDLN